MDAAHRALIQRYSTLKAALDEALTRSERDKRNISMGHIRSATIASGFENSPAVIQAALALSGNYNFILKHLYKFFKYPFMKHSILWFPLCCLRNLMSRGCRWHVYEQREEIHQSYHEYEER